MGNIYQYLKKTHKILRNRCTCWKFFSFEFIIPGFLQWREHTKVSWRLSM